MSPVFGHGRLRLYLLKLLEESPRHGYEIIRLLQDRFLGVYAPSPGTVYPRLARLEEEGLVTHDEGEGRKVYRLTDSGREELLGRLDELEELEREITDSVRDIAREVKEDVRETVRSLREELKHAAHDVRRTSEQSQKQEWREHKERLREQKEAWKQTFRGAPWDFADWTEWTKSWTESPREDHATLERMLNGFRAEMREEVRRAARHGDLDDETVQACRDIIDEAARRLRGVLRGEPDGPGEGD
ncbi:MAG: PadR family transcriptional regulator [Streptosporangiales bacterium]|nr:PadR family transcriptional regulator [Streptosporangiales bacterium]